MKRVRERIDRERESWRHCVVCRVRFISGQEAGSGGDTHERPDIGSDINQSPDGGGLRAAVEAEADGGFTILAVFWGGNRGD